MTVLGQMMLIVFLACSETTLTTDIYNTPPEAMITLPDAQGVASVTEGETLLFQAIVTDADPDHRHNLQARWRVDSEAEAICDYQDPNENGESSCSIEMTVAMTKVTVEVIDPQNALGYDSYLLDVVPTSPPEIEISAPSPDGDYIEGERIALRGVVSDAEDPPENLILTWHSNISGDLDFNGTISEFGLFEGETNLTEGDHRLTATVTDSSGKTTSATVDITVFQLGAPVIDMVDIQDETGLAIDEAMDTQTIYCNAEASDPDNDPLQFSYQWFSESGAELTIDPSVHYLTLNYSSQSLQGGEEITCRVTVSDGLSESTASDSLLLLTCSPFATEYPYDGIDSNCDGLEYLNDQNQDGIADDLAEDYDDDDALDARLGLECLGEAYHNGSETVYFLICDNDHYWKGAQDVCVGNGYDSLATFHDAAEYSFAVDLLNSSRNNYVSPDGSNRSNSAWVGFTRGPDCSPVADTNTEFLSVCSVNVGDYYWLDNANSSWVDSSYWFINEGNNDVEHCAQLRIDPASGQSGFWDLYCAYVATPPHDEWSGSHTRPSICMKRQ